MENPLHIRAFQESDSDAVVALWQRCGLTVPWNDPHKDITRKLAVGRDLFLVGEKDGELIAATMGGYDGHRGWVNYLAVDPNEQEHGYGRLMMTALEEKLLALGCPKINLQIRTSNTGVIQFYKQIGYKMDDVVSMGKRLIPDQESDA
ncbi:MAG: GNAT family acetyltransferase [Chloroflexi bacterium]|nr:GNAT family acetyltransferase [Chloroflexota bacterium]